MPIKEIYVIHHTHVDVGYTDLQPIIRQNQIDFTGRTLDYCTQTNDYPDDAKFRWVHEFSWPVVQFLRAHPDIPVQVVHDASESGLKMKSRLVKDPEWQLADRSVQDLGVYLHDAEKLKAPIWIPESGAAASGARAARKAKTAKERIEAGYSMPVDSAPPKAMLGGVAMAAVAGMALLSDDLMAEHRRQGGTYESGGYG